MPRSPKTRTPPAPEAPTYPIRAVSLMTGLGIDTLRAWERRYGAVAPVRDNRGRVYTSADVQRIRLLHDAVGRGHAIGRVAGMSDEALETLTKASAQAPPPPREQRASLAVDIMSLVSAVERFDAAALETELGRAAALLRAPALLREVLVPLLAEIGDRWHNGRGRVAHEHLLSAAVRNVLGSLLRVHARNGVPDRLLFATPAGERHEFGALGAALLAASAGLGTIYFGPDMPADDIVAVTEVVDLDVVVLGVTGGDAARIDREVAEITARLDPRVELWLGGRGATRAGKPLKGRALVLPTYDALEAQLVRLGGTF